MRVIPKFEADAARPQFVPPSEPVLRPFNETGPIRFIRGAVKNSPWVVMAVTGHVIGLAVLSVVCITSSKAVHADTPTTMGIHKAQAEEDEVVAELPKTEDRGPANLPVPSEQVGPDPGTEVVIPDVKPGRPGEKLETDIPDGDPGKFNPDPDAPYDQPSGSPSGTSIGVHGPGHHGKAPSPWVTARLGGGGHGGGRSGDGGAWGPGGPGPKPTPQNTAVMAALRWLKNHQAPDGHWDGAGFDAQCKMNRCDGPGDSAYSTGLTGLSLLAFLGSGQTHQTGSCRETVKNGLRYLRDVQDSEGCFGSRTSQHFLYNHACATLAMTEAFGMTGSAAFKSPAQRGVGFILKARNPYLAWRYDFPATGDNDTSVTGWMVMALKSAKLSDLEVENQAVKDAISWVDKMTEPEFGRTGYQQRGGPPARTNEMMSKFPAAKSESLTAVGLTVRIFGGHDMKSDEAIGKGADLLAKCLPKWDVDQGTIDYYYWYYGSLAMFQVGGERWNKWKQAMETALLSHQRLEKDRCEYGSWDPIDPWSGEGGRVYSTAINCLTMEVYYRYPLLGVRSETK